MRGEPARERVASRGTPAFPTGRGHPSQIPRNPMRKRTRTPKKPNPSPTDLPPHTHPPSITAAKATTTAACPRPRRRVPSGRGSPARTTSHDAASPPTSTTKTRTPSRCVSFHHMYVRAIRLTVLVFWFCVQWLANSANFYAGEASRTIKSMTDALAEELLGPAEDEEGDIIEEEDASIRGNGEVLTGGAIKGPGRRSKKKEEAAPKPKSKPKRLTEEEEDDEDDVIGGVLNLLGLEDDEEEEVYVRRDCKKDK